ncbi:cytochrome bd-II oxidase subunit CbdX [Shigella flexneri]
MWYLLWFVGICSMRLLSTLVLVWLDPRLKRDQRPTPAH